MRKCLYFLLGGLFDHSDTVQEIAFRYGVDRVNADRDIMPRSRLTAQIERIREQDSFYASKQGMVVPICKIMHVMNFLMRYYISCTIIKPFDYMIFTFQQILHYIRCRKIF